MKKEKIPFGFKSERVFRTAVREHVDIRKSLVEESRNQIRPYKVRGGRDFDYSGFNIHWTNPAYLKLTHELVKSGYKESEIKEMFGFRKGTVQMLKKMLAKEGGKTFAGGQESFENLPFQLQHEYPDHVFRHFVCVEILLSIIKYGIYIPKIPGEKYIINDIIELKNLDYTLGSEHKMYHKESTLLSDIQKCAKGVLVSRSYFEWLHVEDFIYAKKVSERIRYSLTDTGHFLKKMLHAIRGGKNSPKEFVNFLNRATINEEIEDLLDSDDWLGLHYDDNWGWSFGDDGELDAIPEDVFDDYGYSICRWMLDEELVVINNDRLVITSQGREVLHGLRLITYFTIEM